MLGFQSLLLAPRGNGENSFEVRCRFDLASNLLLSKREEVICMQYLVFAIGGGTIVLAAGRAYKLLERWNRRRRLRGAVECLDAVHNTLAGLAECKSGYSESTLPNKRK